MTDRKKSDVQSDEALARSLTGQDGQTDEIAPLEIGELSEGDLDNVQGGAVDYYLKLEGIKGESRIDPQAAGIKFKPMGGGDLRAGYLKIGDIKGE